MISHVLLSLMLATPPAAVNAETVPTYDLGKMTVVEAKRLEGKPVRVTFVVDDVIAFGNARKIHVHVVAKNSTGVICNVTFADGQQNPSRADRGKRLTVGGDFQAFRSTQLDNKGKPQQRFFVLVEGARLVSP